MMGCILECRKSWERSNTTSSDFKTLSGLHQYRYSSHQQTADNPFSDASSGQMSPSSSGVSSLGNSSFPSVNTLFIYSVFLTNQLLLHSSLSFQEPLGLVPPLPSPHPFPFLPQRTTPWRRCCSSPRMAAKLPSHQPLAPPPSRQWSQTRASSATNPMNLKTRRG